MLKTRGMDNANSMNAITVNKLLLLSPFILGECEQLWFSKSLRCLWGMH